MINQCDTKHSEELIRLRKIEGQIKGIQKMIAEDRYCVDILMQVKSAKMALVKVEENILRKHIGSCVHKAFTSGSKGEIDEKINELIEVIYKYS